MDFLAALLQEAVQGFSLGNCTGKAVEDYPFFGFGFVVDDFLQDFYHQRVGNQLSLVYISLGNLAYRSLSGDMVAQHLSGGDMVKAVTLDKFFALGTFSASGGTENHNIHKRL